MSEILKRIEIPITITILCTLLQLVPYFLDIPVLEVSSESFRNWMLLVASWATFVGVINLAQSHIKKIQRRRTGYPYSIIVFIFLIAMVLCGLPIAQAGLGTKNELYKFLYKNVMADLKTVISSMNAFFVTSAAWRAFRARNVEAAIVLSAGVLVICANTPLLSYFWPGFTGISDWIFETPNLATQRSIIIGSALGAIALMVRILMGIERGYLRGERKE